MAKPKRYCNLFARMCGYKQRMETHTSTPSRLRRAIMRRVWYSYVLSVLIHPLTLHGFVLGASAVALKELVYVRSVIHNFMQIPVGKVPTYVQNVLFDLLQNGEFLTLLAFLLFSAASAHLAFRLRFFLRAPRHVGV